MIVSSRLSTRLPKKLPIARAVTWLLWRQFLRLQRPTLALAVLLSSGFLSSCARSSVALSKPLPVPESLLQCKDQPIAPATSTDDTVMATWIVDVVDAGQDCRSKLRIVKGLVSPR